jgi:uncharacterized protein
MTENSSGVIARLHRTSSITVSRSMWARDVFKDPFAVEQLDDRENYGEDRFTIIGMARGRLLFVAYTMRGEIIRIISARSAEPHEQREYHEQDD